ncbi:hypothetical protein [Marivirga sp.]|uniref:hypothetical protein n=1 Tax=Marivirga sp. TaxID=2018662 RepID=UPI002D809097|nr:hypothetical protein [Marivirga sp.]HET8860953.1 hypothetical protein [Marivirga sp.]
MPKHVWLLPFVMLSLIVGIIGGWLRLGWAQFNIPEAAFHHGIIMTGSFMGALISMERAVVMKNKGWFLIPILAILALPLNLLGFTQITIISLVLSSAGLTFLMYIQSMRVKEASHYVITLGAFCWAVGNALLLKSDFIPMVVPWWIAFLLFTIVGERLELSRFLPVKKIFIILLYVLILGVFASFFIPFHFGGSRITGILIACIAFWLLRFDMARKSIKKKGEYQYIGLGLIVAFVWLLVHALIMVFMENHALYYDLWVHSFFLGFAFSMICAHAPIIFPAVVKVKRLIYHPMLYIPWALFQLSLIGRLWFAFIENFELRKLFGIVNGWIIMLMFLSMAATYFWNTKRNKKNPT